MQIRTILICVVLGLVAVASARRPSVAWDRSNDPFMRMASKVADPSMIEAGTIRSLVDAATTQVKTTAPAPTPTPTPAAQAPATPAAAPVVKAGAVVPEGTKVSEPAILPRPASPPADPAKGGAGAASGTSVSAANAVLGMIGQAQTSSGSAADSLNRIMAPTVGAGAQCVGVCQNNTDAGKKDDGGGAFLVAVKKYDNDCSKLGCTPKLSLDSKDFAKAKKVMTGADAKHEEFQDIHAKTCMGKICPEA